MSTYIRVDFAAGIIIERELDIAVSYDRAMSIVKEMIRDYTYHHGACTMFKVEYRNKQQETKPRVQATLGNHKDGKE